MNHQDQVKSSSSLPWTVDRFIEAVDRIMISAPDSFASPESGSGKDLNVRLIRDYVVRGFIPRPGRCGREARFGLDHLVHLLAVRSLLRTQKWSLPAIKASLESTSSAELLTGLLEKVRPCIEREFARAEKAERARPPLAAVDNLQTSTPNSALNLIKKFKSSPGPPANASPQLGAGGSVSERVFFSRVSPNQEGVESATMLHIRLEPWCEIVVDAQAARSLNAAAIRALAKKLTSSLNKNLPH